LSSIITINASQDTSINNVLNTLPSYLQSATASATYLTTSSANLIYAPIANPTFTGTLAAPTVNATSNLQVGGVNISSTYKAKPQVLARITFGTQPSIIASWGAQTLTNSNITNNSVGQYTILLPSSVGVSNYGAFITPRYIQALYCTYGSVGANSFLINTFIATGASSLFTPPSNYDFVVQTTI
jgi:hypothetical protein